jgi:hypothetical protein
MSGIKAGYARLAHEPDILPQDCPMKAVLCRRHGNLDAHIDHRHIMCLHIPMIDSTMSPLIGFHPMMQGVAAYNPSYLIDSALGPGAVAGVHRRVEGGMHIDKASLEFG